ncbi:hypothetical protein QC761_304630 [Podospora bellae-mahoneyi]|uniref:Uncharacterized protein n=1 Tax=Podospora bellae-mahoneyi TaxID=2093777 RepID=A0ABR0FN55_9PEZI|nr:hypothetical protein QC761_304630 [Podospora bellae-mahoneyi]
MANLTIESRQFERDLRHSAKERKRVKDHNTKWQHGSRFLSGVVTEGFWDQVKPVKYSNDAHIAKMKPDKRYVDRYHFARKPTVGQNIVKGRSNWHTPDSVIKNNLAKNINAADLNDANASTIPTLAPQDDVLYSFDRHDSPDRPVTLEVFVKARNTQKETEKLVEKEYEVVDGNGEAVKGRKAKKVLRSGTSERREENEPVVVEGGFELV